MWQGHLIVPGQQNNVPGQMKFLFWVKNALKQYWFPEFCTRPCWPNMDCPILIYLPRNTFYHNRNVFLPNVLGEQKWRNLNKWPFPILLTSLGSSLCHHPDQLFSFGKQFDSKIRFCTKRKKSERPVDALALKTLMTHSVTDNFKSRDASASKKTFQTQGN